MPEVVCCIDVGTSAIKVGLLDPDGGTVAFVECPATVSTAAEGAVECDAPAYYTTCAVAIKRALAQSGLPASAVAALAITNQRATVVPVGADGDACGPAISWQDTRGGDAVRRFSARVDDRTFAAITGLPPSALWSLAKILWLHDTSPTTPIARFVLLHDYLLHRCGADAWVTDPSNASLTGLLDLRTLSWSDTILAAAGITAAQLPQLQPAASVAGHLSIAAARETGLLDGTPLIVGGGDQQCAALGIGAVDPGVAGVCLGTAAVISYPIDRPAFDEAGRFFCTAHAAPGRWVMEGIHNAFGSSSHWGSRMLGTSSAAEFDALAAGSTPGAGGMIYLPFLAGIGSPDFDADARGALLGLDLSHQPADVARAILEGMALEIRRISEPITAHVDVRQFIIAGAGATRSLRVQILADVLGRPLLLNPVPQATLLGAAILAWTGIGRYPDVATGTRACTSTATQLVESIMDDVARASAYHRYCQAVTQVRQLTGAPIGSIS